jgi:hypothetical protein
MSKNKIIRHKKPEGPRLTDDRKIFLLMGWHFDISIAKGLFRDEKEMEICWRENKKFLMSFCQIRMAKRDFDITYQHLRPWAYWKFELGLPEIGYRKFFSDIHSEFKYLEDNGLLIPTDRERMKEYDEIIDFRKGHMRKGDDLEEVIIAKNALKDEETEGLFL